MISTELLRRYSFFAGLDPGQMDSLSMAAHLMTAEAGESFFREGDPLTELYFLVDGRVDIAVVATDRSKEHSVSKQLTGDLAGRDITVSTLGPGEIFGWSSLLPPHNATASATAVKPCQVVAFNRDKLVSLFQKDCELGYLMMLKVANVIRQRLRDMQVQSLAFVAG